MLPLVGVPPTIAAGMKKYREVFCRDAGFDHVSRYVSGPVLCENKTLPGIYAQQVWPEGEEVSRRAMHAGVFEAGYSVKEAYDYVNRRESLFQTVVTAVVSNRELIDGLAVEVQQPDFAEAEMEYLVMTRQENYTQMEEARERIVELVAYQRNRQAYRSGSLSRVQQASHRF